MGFLRSITALFLGMLGIVGISPAIGALWSDSLTWRAAIGGFAIAPLFMLTAVWQVKEILKEARKDSQYANPLKGLARLPMLLIVLANCGFIVYGYDGFMSTEPGRELPDRHSIPIMIMGGLALAGISRVYSTLTAERPVRRTVYDRFLYIILGLIPITFGIISYIWRNADSADGMYNDMALAYLGLSALAGLVAIPAFVVSKRLGPPVGYVPEGLEADYFRPDPERFFGEDWNPTASSGPAHDYAEEILKERAKSAKGSAGSGQGQQTGPQSAAGNGSFWHDVEEEPAREAAPEGTLRIGYVKRPEGYNKADAIRMYEASGVRDNPGHTRAAEALAHCLVMAVGPKNARFFVEAAARDDSLPKKIRFAYHHALQVMMRADAKT
ncbi:MAG: hypothetical protein GVY29_13405 [Spirochaetes bacterium]|jgi:hypothetical protein|nr:hypothetical protein [Spirochaetota bacterium]